ncbi:MAG: hypothetical protein KAX20_06025 [Candidatus Omnitrophica bacterium]|nr:hypothetical protein [Candidatus Omnitrophota bacterium]
MGKFICHWCGEPLKLTKDKGWVHLDGDPFKTRKTIKDGKEIEITDHIAMPEKMERGEKERK